MKYGLIGEKLGHSFSKVIHERLGYDYELCEISPENLDAFMRKRDFLLPHTGRNFLKIPNEKCLRHWVN